MSGRPDLPKGCMGCNADEIGPILKSRGITVVELDVATPWSAVKDVVVCQECGRAWLLMPREGDPRTPVA